MAQQGREKERLRKVQQDQRRQELAEMEQKLSESVRV